MINNKNDDNFDIAIKIWERASISLIDIRHYLISRENPVNCYRMPANAFLYTCAGKAEVSLDNISYYVERFGMFHGGQGTELSIQPIDHWLEYYIVLYKVGAPPFHKREYIRLLTLTNPFRQNYGFIPNDPIFFAEQLRRMYERWNSPTSLQLFYGKAAFYQLIYVICEELEKGHVRLFEPDTAAMARGYIRRNFNRQISVQSLADVLGISAGHLRSTFKNQYGCSPQEYLTQIRIQEAKRLLSDSAYKLREIAACTGFYDEYHMSRVFKKYEGMSPLNYRGNAIYPLNTCDSSIGNAPEFVYNEEYQVSLNELIEEGVKIMFKNMRSKTILPAALSLMLLLSACNTAPVGSSQTETAPAQTSQTSETETVQTQEDSTRTIDTVVGEVEIPTNPQRIIIPYYDRDLLAFGLKPLALSSNYDGAAGYEQLKDLEVIESWEQEDIMALNPDLIIWLVAEDYEKYASIAPTVIIPSNYTLEERITFMGKIFDQEETAEKILSDFEKKVETAKQQLSDAGILDKTVSIVQDMKTGTYVFGDRNGRGGNLIYNLLGMPAPENIRTQLLETEDTYYLPISLEVIPEYMGDYILLVDSEEGAQGFQDNNIWKSLPAVEQDRIINLNYGLFFYNDITSYQEQLDYLVEELLSKADTF